MESRQTQWHMETIPMPHAQEAEAAEEPPIATTRTRRLSTTPKPANLKPSVRLGLESLCESKYATAAVNMMLSADTPGDTLADKLAGRFCVTMN